MAHKFTLVAGQRIKLTDRDKNMAKTDRRTLNHSNPTDFAKNFKSHHVNNISAYQTFRALLSTKYSMNDLLSHYLDDKLL